MTHPKPPPDQIRVIALLQHATLIPPHMPQPEHPDIHQVLGLRWRAMADAPASQVHVLRFRWHLSPSERRTLFRACADGRAVTCSTRRGGRIVLLGRLTGRAAH